MDRELWLDTSPSIAYLVVVRGRKEDWKISSFTWTPLIRPVAPATLTWTLAQGPTKYIRTQNQWPHCPPSSSQVFVRAVVGLIYAAGTLRCVLLLITYVDGRHVPIGRL